MIFVFVFFFDNKDGGIDYVYYSYICFYNEISCLWRGSVGIFGFCVVGSWRIKFWFGMFWWIFVVFVGVEIRMILYKRNNIVIIVFKLWILVYIIYCISGMFLVVL